MDRISKLLQKKKRKATPEQNKEEEEQLRLEVLRRQGGHHTLSIPTELLREAMNSSNNSPREVVPSPRPLPPELMKQAIPRKQKRGRASLNGKFFSDFSSVFFFTFFFLLFSF